MKRELAAYKARICSDPPACKAARRRRQDTFDIQVWWRESEASLLACLSTQRAVLCRAPNSAAPERALRILSDSNGDDQSSPKKDYKKAITMPQYNNRCRD
jgi:hypothetical protein